MITVAKAAFRNNLDAGRVECDGIFLSMAPVVTVRRRNCRCGKPRMRGFRAGLLRAEVGRRITCALRPN